MQEGGAEHLQVLLVDLPSNNWNQVASVFFKPGAVADSDLILPVMVPRSFYAGECAPPGSLHIGTSCDAAQWLSHVPPVSYRDSFSYKDAGRPSKQAPLQRGRLVRHRKKRSTTPSICCYTGIGAPARSASAVQPHCEATEHGQSE